jgi:CDP-diacylglycerol---serine O-phosphatidyltransferase
MSILTSVEALRTSRSDLLIVAAQLIMLTLILDGLDGFMARALRGTSEFGAELDTFVDFSAFGVAPAVLLFAVLLNGDLGLWRFILPALIVVSGACRLARFRTKDPQRGLGGYTGLPITLNATWVALSVFVTQILFPGEPILTQGPFAVFFQACILLFITLQVSSVRYPKPEKNLVLFFTMISIGTLLWILQPLLAVRVALLFILLGLAFVLSPVVRWVIRRP